MRETKRHFRPRAPAAEDERDAEPRQGGDRRPRGIVVAGQGVEERAVDPAHDHPVGGHDATTRRGRAVASGWCSSFSILSTRTPPGTGHSTTSPSR